MDNPGTWLDFTDLVFIDPIGTGFSRSLVPEADAKKLFYTTVPRHRISVARGSYDRAGYERPAELARKYLVGESYGGFRGLRITRTISRASWCVAMNGVGAGYRRT